jgi:hypothetical protein
MQQHPHAAGIFVVIVQQQAAKGRWEAALQVIPKQFEPDPHGATLCFKEQPMSTRTTSEELFERLCAQKHLEYVRIPEGAAKTADYRLTLGRVTLITEVKQLDPSPDEQHIAETWGTRQSPGAIAPSDRVQGFLEEGYPQSNNPPAKPGAFDCEPLKAAI